MAINKQMISELTDFRKELHQYPELSHEEKNTQIRLLKFAEALRPDKIIKNIGGHGLAFIYDSGKSGDTVLFRADMDALPIAESNDLRYVSKNKGVAHLCGHDGHMVILSGLAKIIDKNRPQKGKVVLLFQPAEETGEGANLVINDKNFPEIKPDYSFAFHNLPGFEKNKIVIKKGAFASASTGLIIELKGLSSHAAHPEDGNNPDKCIADLITEFNKISGSENNYKDFILTTVIHIKLGEIAFGTTPGKADFMATLRTFRNDDMQKLQLEINGIIKKICEKHKIKYKVSYTEEFPACINNDEAYDTVINAVEQNGFDYENLEKPFRWSEDFGHFSIISKSAIFGIGSGKDHPQLHNENYDFPDEIIETGLSMFYSIYKKILF